MLTLNNLLEHGLNNLLELFTWFYVFCWVIGHNWYESRSTIKTITAN